jgi:hypothetical protein
MTPDGGPGPGVGASRLARPHVGIDAAVPVVIDVDSTLVTAHSDKESVAATYKRGFGVLTRCGRSLTRAGQTVGGWEILGVRGDVGRGRVVLR